MSRDQGANAEQRPRKGLAGIYRMLRWEHPSKVRHATKFRKIDLGWAAR
jgi:hypothetical protein